MDKKQTYHHRERQLHKDKERRLSTKYKITQKKNNVKLVSCGSKEFCENVGTTLA